MDDRTRLSLEDLGRTTSRPRGNGEHERKRRQPVGRVFWTRSRKEAFAAWLFIFPDCIGLFVFVAIPMVLALSLGFFSVDGFGGMVQNVLSGDNARVCNLYLVVHESEKDPI
jgi:hypothetical protein